MSGSPERFRLEFRDEDLSDLRDRLRSPSYPDRPSDDGGWTQGTDLDYLVDLVDYWANQFDWRAQERWLNSVEHYRVRIDGHVIHYVHVRGNGDGLPLLMAHGWPSSFVEMMSVIPFLTDPSGSGGSPGDAFDIVVPSLPGFGLSDPILDGWDEVPTLWHRLMTDVLGYERYGAHGGDIGAWVIADLARRHRDALIGVHLISDWADRGAPGFGETEDERDYIRRDDEWEREEGGYAHIQGTKPLTLAYGLTDSAVGLAAWIVEKFRAWSDCDGDLDRSFSRDALLTNITLYWLTNTIGTSFLPYYFGRHRTTPRDHARIDVPTGIARLPADDPRAPGRSAAERSYNVIHWTEMPRGGHFAAMEVPDLLVEDIRAFFRPLRSVHPAAVATEVTR